MESNQKNETLKIKEDLKRKMMQRLLDNHKKHMLKLIKEKGADEIVITLPKVENILDFMGYLQIEFVMYGFNKVKEKEGSRSADIWHIWEDWQNTIGSVITCGDGDVVVEFCELLRGFMTERVMPAHFENMNKQKGGSSGIKL